MTAFRWAVEVFHAPSKQWLVWSRERNRDHARYGARIAREAIENTYFTRVRYARNERAS